MGKTTLSQSIGHSFEQKIEYLNWDFDADRRMILNHQWLDSVPLVIFDELHKYPKWKQWIKGVYDTKPNAQQYLVTGSARLDTYRRGGDSLMGRYHYWRLHPFTLDELPDNLAAEEAYKRLLTVGGFPEPFLLGDEREAKRWRKERFDRILREDVRDLARIHEIQLLGLFVDALRERVSSQIVFSNLAEDLQISPKTSKTWLQLIERLYVGFSVYPLTKNVPRAIQKPPKLFFYDTGDVIGDLGAKLENLVATHLLKRLQFREDYFGERCKLHYLRDKDGREVDFVVVIDGRVDELIEVKLRDSDPSPALRYYKDRLFPRKTTQIVGELKRGFDVDQIEVRNPIEYFKNPPWAI